MKELVVLFLLMFISPLLASGIDANATDATCDNSTLETYSGTANVEINWVPNTINLSWYNGNEKMTVQQSAQTCSYDDLLTIPSTQPTRTGYTFIGWTVRLPGTYTELEYIQGTGTQYIDTNFIPDNNTRIRTKVQFDSDIDGRGTVFSSSLSKSGNNGFECFMYGNGSRIYFFYGEGRGYGIGYLTQAANVNDVLEMDWNRNILNYKKNNENMLQATFDEQTFTTAYQLRLFSLSRGFAYGNDIGRIKMYYFQIYDNGVLVRDFIPARRNSDDVVGMYDTVGQTFYTNPGTGNFVAGPVVQ